MEALKCQLSAEKYDATVHAKDALPEGGDMEIFVKPRATVGGNAGAVITFTVQLPDGTTRRAQAVTTVILLENALACLRGWRSGGHLLE